MRPVFFWLAFWPAFWMASGRLPAQDSIPAGDPFAEAIQWQLREQRYYVSLAAKLKPQLPQLSTLLALDPPRESDTEALQSHIRMVADLARKSHALPPPMFLLLADRLATMLGYSWAPQSAPVAHDFNVGPLRFVYHYDQLGATWVYDHALARQIYRDYPGTPAGEWALLTLEKLGWNTGVACPDGPDLFRTVIAESGRFLSRHRNSPYRLDFLLDLAAAYETWWALSQARPDDEYVIAANYTPGAEAARRRAIELYQQIAREAPKSDFAAYAKPTLARLQAKLDTGQRQYYCIYD
jgi:hypothetical protein